MKMPKKICVVGAGSSGLAAIKSCKEEGLLVQCYEKADGIGGLWRYHESDDDGRPSVMRTTIINTTKELSAYSDFPPPKEFGNFMHNSFMLKYFELYAEYFDLVPCIRFNHEVRKVEKHADYETTGKWNVYFKNSHGKEKSEVYDGVMVCSGHHIYPNIPDFPGLELFKGTVIHSHSLKRGDSFENKKVVVVGIGNSAVDAVVETASFANKVYLSTRRGSWIQPRVFLWGTPCDTLLQRRVFDFGLKFDVFQLLPSLWQALLNFQFDHASFGLRPKHGILNAHPTINDALPGLILSGRVSVRKNISRFVENGVIFDEENDVTEVDAVVFATGYDIKFPFFDESILKVENNAIDLYKLMIPPALPHPSLVIIALTQPLGCMFPIAEAQSRWFALLVQGKLKLPSREDMEKDIRKSKSALSKRYVSSARHTVQVDYIPYMDDICSQFGAKPSMLKLAFTDPKLFHACFFQQCVAYQYRLYGPHAWSGARQAILTANDRVQKAINA